MHRKPWYTSEDLIEAVKRKIAMPMSQVLFDEEDILEFANEELFLSQVPSILQYHEEYLVFTEEVDLEDSVSEYDIPSRAIGMKLRDIFFKDSNGNLSEMVNVGASNRDYFSYNSNNFQNPRNYVIEGNTIALLPGVQGITPGSLVMKYYLRPNSLVLNERAVICTNFVKLMTVDNTSLISGDKLTIGEDELIAGTDFAIGATSALTASNIETALNALSGDVTAEAADVVITLSFSDRNTELSTDNTAAFVISDDTGINCDEMPENIVTGILADFLQTAAGHKTYSFGKEVQAVSGTVAFFDENDIPEKFAVGDYVCQENECIIPQIPSDLHNLLAERTCARILESLGDVQGAQTQNTKIADLEARQAVLIDNRTEGSPKKVFNRNSLLRCGKNRRIGRGIF